MAILRLCQSHAIPKSLMGEDLTGEIRRSAICSSSVHTLNFNLVFKFGQTALLCPVEDSAGAEQQKNRDKMGMSEQAWLKRQAMALVSTLPDDPQDAKAILRLANELVERFIEEKPEAIQAAYSQACRLRPEA